LLNANTGLPEKCPLNFACLCSLLFCHLLLLVMVEVSDIFTNLFLPVHVFQGQIHYF